ncbi:MAG: dihydrofolate reductase [Myxococcales bacterium]|nr:dihydrofolate reductase [Myxococcales bacterium]MCB9582536.1 dihydrofolate reductase [Polyangiaceae bacterium]
MAGRVRVYIACSLDGFIAGPEDDLSWLPGADGTTPDASASSPGALSFEAFMSDVGALLMGRRTYDVVSAFGGDWPYGERVVCVATHRPLKPKVPSVHAVEGSIHQMIEHARSAAGGTDVYLDGGELIRQALDAKLVDHLVVTLVPVALGTGQPLFAGVSQRHAFRLEGSYRFAENMVQLHLQTS